MRGCMFILRQAYLKMAILLHTVANWRFIMIIAVYKHSLLAVQHSVVVSTSFWSSTTGVHLAQEHDWKLCGLHCKYFNCNPFNYYVHCKPFVGRFYWFFLCYKSHCSSTVIFTVFGNGIYCDKNINSTDKFSRMCTLW